MPPHGTPVALAVCGLLVYAIPKLVVPAADDGVVPGVVLRAVAVLESAAAIGIACPKSRRLGLVVSGALFSGFVGFSFVHLLSDTSVDCGCMGAVSVSPGINLGYACAFLLLTVSAWREANQAAPTGNAAHPFPNEPRRRF